MGHQWHTLLDRLLEANHDRLAPRYGTRPDRGARDDHARTEKKEVGRGLSAVIHR